MVAGTVDEPVPAHGVLLADGSIHGGEGRVAFSAVTDIGAVVNLAGGHGGAAVFRRPGGS